MPTRVRSFTNAIQLSCTVIGSTPAATCALSPTSVALGANARTSTLTVTVPTQSTELIPSRESQPLGPFCAVFLPLPLALIGFGWASGKLKQRQHRLWLLYSLFVAFIALQAGCGGGSTSTPPPPPTLSLHRHCYGYFRCYPAYEPGDRHGSIAGRDEPPIAVRNRSLWNVRRFANRCPRMEAH
jgi:hypothetical protein